jgi:hypothetical protein
LGITRTVWSLLGGEEQGWGKRVDSVSRYFKLPRTYG